MSSVTAILLAGGYSRRMGKEKALLPVPGQQGQSFVQHLTTLLSHCCQRVVLVVRDDEQAHYLCEHLSSAAHIVYDLLPGAGPLIGLYSGLQASMTSHALVTAVDMPFIQPALLDLLLAPPLGEEIVVPLVAQVPQVLLALYPRQLLPVIEQCIEEGRRDLRGLLDRTQVRFLPEATLRAVDPDLLSFRNFNTPEELASP